VRSPLPSPQLAAQGVRPSPQRPVVENAPQSSSEPPRVESRDRQRLRANAEGEDTRRPVELVGEVRQWDLGSAGSRGRRDGSRARVVYHAGDAGKEKVMRNLTLDGAVSAGKTRLPGGKPRPTGLHEQSTARLLRRLERDPEELLGIRVHHAAEPDVDRRGTCGEELVDLLAEFAVFFEDPGRRRTHRGIHVRRAGCKGGIGRHQDGIPSPQVLEDVRHGIEPELPARCVDRRPHRAIGRHREQRPARPVEPARQVLPADARGGDVGGGDGHGRIRRVDVGHAAGFGDRGRCELQSRADGELRIGTRIAKPLELLRNELVRDVADLPAQARRSPPPRTHALPGVPVRRVEPQAERTDPAREVDGCGDLDLVAPLAQGQPQGQQELHVPAATLSGEQHLHRNASPAMGPAPGRVGPDSAAADTPRRDPSPRPRRSPGVASALARFGHRASRSSNQYAMLRSITSSIPYFGRHPRRAVAFAMSGMRRSESS